MSKRMLALWIVVACLPPLAHSAAIYRCTDAKGAAMFSQVPCGKDASQVGASGSAGASTATYNDTAGDHAALKRIDEQCTAKSRQIRETYSARFADANAEVADLHKQLSAATAGAKGTPDPSIRNQIQAVEVRKTELLGSQDRELSTLDRTCQSERESELRRQADRDAQHSVVKR